MANSEILWGPRRGPVASTLTPTLLATVLVGLLIAGCTQQQGRDMVEQVREGQPQEFFQTSVDRMATLELRDNLQSLYRLMDKLYQRNPKQLPRSGYVDRISAERAVRTAIEQQQGWAQLGERRDLEALSHALAPEFRGDRVGAFIYALGSMIVTAHGNRLQFYMTDTIDPKFVHNAARNIERATWLLAQRRDAEGEPLLYANEISEAEQNLSFAVEFGKIVARLDLLSEMLDERYRRIGLNYAQSLLFLNFLPVQ